MSHAEPPAFEPSQDAPTDSWGMPAHLPHWDRLRAEENQRRARQAHLTLHPAFAQLMAANDQDESWVCWLLSQKDDGLTPLMKACMTPGGLCARILLPFGSPDARDRLGSTALMFAAEHSNAEACALLAPLSPLAARGAHGLDALGLARDPACRESILFAMARAERAQIGSAATDGDDGARGSGSSGRRL